LASQYEEAFIDSVGGRLFVRSWNPQSAARAALVAVHDFNSHGGRYERFAIHLAEHGIAVHALDLRFAHSVDDIDALMRSDRVRQRSMPLFVMGHGAGAVAVSVYALRRKGSLAGLICESIALDLPVSAALFGWVRVRHFAAFIRARSRLRSSLAQLSLPLLVLHGSSDTATLPSGSEHMHGRSASPDKTLQIFEGYYHDLINGQGHEQVAERILRWIEDRLNPEHRNQIGIAYINADT
jgi:alpha-beta hydrolase superfamily lysophospholipase